MRLLWPATRLWLHTRTDPITLELTFGDRLVVTGAKGTGKSTLLDVLAGTLHPTLGTVRRSPTTRLGYLGTRPICSALSA